MTFVVLLAFIDCFLACLAFVAFVAFATRVFSAS